MFSSNIHSSAVYPKNLVITLRKVMAKVQELNNMKIMITIKTNMRESQHVDESEICRNTYQISQAQKVKNGMACFYGESIVLNQAVRNFTITVFQEPGQNLGDIRKELAKFYIGKDQIKEFSERKLVLVTHSDAVDLVWEAQLQSERSDQDQAEQKYQDRSLDDFDDIQVKISDNTKKQKTSRKSFSPPALPTTRPRQNTFNRDNSRSQLISESPHKLTTDTNETIVQIKRKVLIAEPTNKKKQSLSLQKIKKSFRSQQNLNISYQQDSQQAKEQKKIDKFQHPVLATKKMKPVTQTFKYSKQIKQELKNSIYKQNKGQHYVPKKKEKLLDKITLKSILYTSMIGIIGGVTAAQF